MRYAVTLTTEDDGTVLVSVPDVPEALTFGEDRQDALARAVDAIETAFMGRIAAREDISPPTASGPDTVALPALTVAKLALYTAMRKDGVGKAELARRLGLFLPQVDRLLDLRNQSRLDMMERALAALGRSIVLDVRAA